MTLIPRTISRSVRADIPQDNYTQESLFQKLNRNPKLLLKFFLQATQNQFWCTNNTGLMHRMFNQIFKFVISGELPFDYAIESCSSLIKYNLKVYEELFYDPSKKSYAGIPLLYAVPSTFSDLKQAEVYKMTNVAPYVNVGEFAALYTTFQSNIFTHFHYISAPSLESCLIQCKVWGYTQGLVEIQNIFTQRILCIFDTFRAYFFATENDLAVLRCYTENRALNYQWKWYVIEGTKVCYSLNIVIPFNYRISSVSYTDLAKLTYSSENEKCSAGNCSERLDIAFISEKIVAISLRNMNAIQYLTFKNTVTQNAPTLINYLKIEYMTFERSLPLLDGFILGLCTLCKRIFEIHFTGGEKCAEFIRKLGIAAPQVKSFGIYDIELIDVDILKAISHAFHNLRSLSLLNIPKIDSLSHECLSKLLCLSLENIGEIRQTNILNIQELKIRNIEWNKLKNFISCCYQVQMILINSVAGFKLSEYPYPQKIIELTIDANTLSQSLEGTDLSTINEFINLKEIIVIGTPSETLKRALESLPKHMTFKIDRDTKE